MDISSSIIELKYGPSLIALKQKKLIILKIPLWKISLAHFYQIFQIIKNSYLLSKITNKIKIRSKAKIKHNKYQNIDSIMIYIVNIF